MVELVVVELVVVELVVVELVAVELVAVELVVVELFVGEPKDFFADECRKTTQSSLLLAPIPKLTNKLIE